MSNERINTYVADNMDNLANAAARGQGEYLNTLAVLMDVPEVSRTDFYARLAEQLLSYLHIAGDQERRCAQEHRSADVALLDKCTGFGEEMLLGERLHLFPLFYTVSCSSGTLPLMARSAAPLSRRFRRPAS